MCAIPTYKVLKPIPTHCANKANGSDKPNAASGLCPVVYAITVVIIPAIRGSGGTVPPTLNSPKYDNSATAPHLTPSSTLPKTIPAKKDTTIGLNQ